MISHLKLVASRKVVVYIFIVCKCEILSNCELLFLMLFQTVYCHYFLMTGYREFSVWLILLVWNLEFRIFGFGSFFCAWCE